MIPSLSSLLDAIEARVKEATQGQWSCDQCGDVWAVNVTPRSTDEVKYKAIGTTRFYSNENADAIFIASAPTDVARLCEALRVAINQRDGFMVNYHAATNVNLMDQDEIKKDIDEEIRQILNG